MSQRYQNWQRHFTRKRISSKMTFPNKNNRWKGIVQKSWQDTPTQFCVCKDSENIYFVKVLDYQFLWNSFFLSVGSHSKHLKGRFEETYFFSCPGGGGIFLISLWTGLTPWTSLTYPLSLTLSLYLPLFYGASRNINGMASSVSYQSVSHDSHVGCHENFEEFDILNAGL